jgi:uncharacterized membrane protein YjdF
VALFMFPLSIIIAVAGSYQIFEWIYAVSVDATAGTAVPGSQGEPRDAQKDRFAGTLGAVTALLLFTGCIATRCRRQYVPDLIRPVVGRRPAHPAATKTSPAR